MNHALGRRAIELVTQQAEELGRRHQNQLLQRVVDPRLIEPLSHLLGKQLRLVL